MTTTTSPKFCKDCAHYRPPRGKFAECSAPVPQNLNLVHGQYTGFCNCMREERGACGIEAKLFEPAPKSDDKFSTDRPLIVFAWSGAGKSQLAKVIANHFSKSLIADEWSPVNGHHLSENHAAFSNAEGIPGAVHIGEVLIKMGSDLLNLSPAEAASRRADQRCSEDPQSPA